MFLSPATGSPLEPRCGGRAWDRARPTATVAAGHALDGPAGVQNGG